MSDNNSKKKSVAILALIVILLLLFVVFNQKFQGSTSISKAITESGFVEFKPPSKLATPGSWVTVLNVDPLHLGIICTPANSIGLINEEKLLKSTSADINIVTKLSESFALDSTAMSKVRGDIRFEALQNVTLQLNNIRILEVPDDLITGGVKNRTEDCWTAIKLRMSKKTPVTMVKSVLIADVDYQLSFKREMSAEAMANVKKQLALKLDLRLTKGEAGNSQISGVGLIWGVREDPILAKYGLSLPATGGQDTPKKVLGSKGAVTKISMQNPIRRQFSAQDTVASYQVQPLRQSSQMSCWATVYTMMKSWKDQNKLSVTTIIAELGDPWTDYYLTEQGLPPGKERAFVEVVGMKSTPPANYNMSAYVDMLKNHGPLWLIMRRNISSHALLLVGIYGNPEAEGIKAYEETTFEYIDPWTGTYTCETGLETMNRFESEARWIVDNNLNHIDFRDQILYFP